MEKRDESGQNKKRELRKGLEKFVRLSLAGAALFVGLHTDQTQAKRGEEVGNNTPPNVSAAALTENDPSSSRFIFPFLPEKKRPIVDEAVFVSAPPLAETVVTSGISDGLEENDGHLTEFLSVRGNIFLEQLKALKIVLHPDEFRFVNETIAAQLERDDPNAVVTAVVYSQLPGLGYYDGRAVNALTGINQINDRLRNPQTGRPKQFAPGDTISVLPISNGDKSDGLINFFDPAYRDKYVGEGYGGCVAPTLLGNLLRNSYVEVEEYSEYASSKKVLIPIFIEVKSTLHDHLIAQYGQYGSTVFQSFKPFETTNYIIKVNPDLQQRYRVEIKGINTLGDRAKNADEYADKWIGDFIASGDSDISKFFNEIPIAGMQVRLIQADTGESVPIISKNHFDSNGYRKLIGKITQPTVQLAITKQLAREKNKEDVTTKSSYWRLAGILADAGFSLQMPYVKNENGTILPQTMREGYADLFARDIPIISGDTAPNMKLLFGLMEEQGLVSEFKKFYFGDMKPGGVVVVFAGEKQKPYIVFTKRVLARGGSPKTEYWVNSLDGKPSKMFDDIGRLKGFVGSNTVVFEFR